VSGPLLPLRRSGERLLLDVRVTPGAARSRILGIHDASLRVAVQAPPEKGKANQALLRFLAEVLGVPRASLTLTSGETSRRKRIAISKLEEAAVRERLATHLP